MMTASPMMNPTFSAEPTDNALPAPESTSPVTAVAPGSDRPESQWAKTWGRWRETGMVSLRACGNTHFSALWVLVGCLYTWDTAVVVLSAVLGIAFFDNYKCVAWPTASLPGWLTAVALDREGCAMATKRRHTDSAQASPPP